MYQNMKLEMYAIQKSKKKLLRTIITTMTYKIKKIKL